MNVGDHPDAELVSDLGQRVGEHGPAALDRAAFAAKDSTDFGVRSESGS